MEGLVIDRATRLIALLLLGWFAAGTVGCAARGWSSAVRADTPAAYYRFMREHPGSSKIEDAKEHLEFLKLKRNPSLEGFEAFSAMYPDSELSDELRPLLEPQAFDVARAQGTAESYQRFLDQFPAGQLASRALGNIAYIESAGFAGDAVRLADFAKQHPESDFAAEAVRSAEGLAVRQRSGFGRVGLSIEISPATAEPDRLSTAFRERAEEIYARSGLELVLIPEIADASSIASLPKARLTISHGESEVLTKISGGDLSRPGMVAKTVITLVTENGAKPIFEREFGLRVDSSQYLAGTSVLFSSSAPYYWDAFFVPVASWQSSASLRTPVALSGTAVDVDAAGDRSVVLYEDGSFQLIELADPGAPVVLAEYTRPKDFKRWTGVRILGDHVAIFGEEGIEFIRFGAGGPELAASRSRSEIGTVFAIESIDDQLVVAGARGLLLLHRDGDAIKRVMRRVIKGLAVVDESLIFTDGESLFVSTLALLGQNRVTAQMKLGKAFAPSRVRSFGTRAVALGRGGVLVMDLRNPQKPVVSAKLLAKDIGHVTDATAIGGRIFLLGDRGLQMLDAKGARVAESVDVKVHGRVATMGRHVVAIGSESLQVVDSTPLTARPQPAAPPASTLESAQ